MEKNPKDPGVQPNWYQYITLAVPSNSQNDNQWKCDLMHIDMDTVGACPTPPPGTLNSGGAGCALTSTTSVFQYDGDTHTPSTLNTCLGDNADPIHWDVAAQSCSSGKASFTSKSYHISNSDASDLAMAGLVVSKPPIVEAIKDSNSNDTHWMVVVAVAGDPRYPASYTVMDPWDGTQKNLGTYLTDKARHLNSYVIYTKL